MTMLETALLVVHLLIAIAICGFVLLQHGKGADMGAAFGSGASGSLFGAAGSANFLSRTTAILAAVFFLSSLGLTYFATTHTGPSGVMQQGVMEKMAPKSSEVPAAPTSSDVPAAPGSSPSGASPSDVPKAPADMPKPPAPASDGSKAGEIPK
jgi:preprotein translocase subunit SecG